MTIRVCFAGATGWAGSALARSIVGTDDIEIAAVVSRTHAGYMLGDVLAEPRLTCPIYATAEQALGHPCDVFFEYTKPQVAKANTLAALHRGAHVVIGTSGLTDADYAEIATVAETQQRGVLALSHDTQMFKFTIMQQDWRHRADESREIGVDSQAHVGQEVVVSTAWFASSALLGARPIRV